MGINGLTQLIKKNAPGAIETTNLHKISGSKVAIDSSLFIYKALTCRHSPHTITTPSTPSTTHSSTMTDGDSASKDGVGKDAEVSEEVIKPKDTSHITSIFYKTINYLAVNIEPIYIFDGKPPEAKKAVIQQRRAKSQENQKLMLTAKTSGEKDKFEKQSFRMTREHIDDIKKLLDLMGVSYLQADGEAEAYASELCRIGYVDYVVTEDMDTLAFGAPKMIRTNIDRSLKRSDLISIIDLSKILETFELSYDEFLEVCIMSGCDYCSNISRIGPAKSYSFIKEFKNIEEAIVKKKLDIPVDYVEKVCLSRKLFKMYHGSLKIENLDIQSSTIQREELEKYLVEDCKMSITRVQKALNKTVDAYK